MQQSTLDRIELRNVRIETRKILDTAKRTCLREDLYEFNQGLCDILADRGCSKIPSKLGWRRRVLGIDRNNHAFLSFQKYRTKSIINALKVLQRHFKRVGHMK